MATGTLEVLGAEGGDDRNDAVALALIREKLEEVPALDVKEVYDFLASQAVKEVTAPEVGEPEKSDQTAKDVDEIRGGRGMIYSNIAPIVLGGAALKHSVHAATQFRPAGTGGSRTLARLMGQPGRGVYARRRNGHPPINGVF